VVARWLGYPGDGKKNFHHRVTEAPRKTKEKTENDREQLEIFSVSQCLSGEKLLFQHAVVELFASPVGRGLDEGQDYGMGIFFGRR
jgi:hypothetical protein